MTKNDPVRYVAPGAAFALLGKGFGKGAHLLAQIVLAQRLGPDGFGLFAIAWTLLRVVGVLLPAGLDTGVLRFGAEVRDSEPARLKNLVSSAAGLGAAIGLLLGGLIWIFAPTLADRVFEKPELTLILRTLAVAFPLIPVLRIVSAATLLSRRTIYAVAAEDVGQPVANLVLLILLGLGQLTLLDAAVAAVVSFAVAVTLALAGLAGGLRSPSGPLRVDKGLGRLIAYSLPALSVGVFGNWIVWSDRLFLGALLPADQTGLYQAASQLIVLFALVLGSFNTILAPLAAELLHSGSREDLQRLYRLTTRWGLAVSAPAVALFFTLPQDLLELLFGPRYGEASTALLILLIGQVINLGTGGVALLLVLAGQQKKWLVLSMSAFCLNLALNYLLIPRFGMRGAAVATSVAVIALQAAALLLVRVVMKVWPYDRQTAKVVVAAAVATTLTGLGPDFSSAWTRVAFGAAVATLSFWAILALLGLPKDDLRAARWLFRRQRPSKPGFHQG